jgi:DNA topoisomerase I
MSLIDNTECEELAASAGLLYVSDDAPGIRRIRRGRGFSYLDAGNRSITSRDERAWIASIAIPPAWTDVWICPTHDGHILATGRDQKGRKQYRYHPCWREACDLVKFERIGAFADALPEVRGQVDAHLRMPGLPEERVLALVVRLLDETLIRVGNTEYADANDTYGLTTMRADDVNVTATRIEFTFTAKGGADCNVAVRDPRLARIVKACEDLGGYELFAYRGDEGEVVDVTSSDVNDYLRSIAGSQFSAKDFRTWGGTVVAAETLIELGPPESHREATKATIAAADRAAEALGNTRATARSSYVAPAVLDAYEDGSLQRAWKSSREGAWMRKAEHAVSKVLAAAP